MNPYDQHRRRRVATSSNEEALPFNRWERGEMEALQLLLQQHQEAQYLQACAERERLAQEEMRFREIMLRARVEGGLFEPLRVEEEGRWMGGDRSTSRQNTESSTSGERQTSQDTFATRSRESSEEEKLPSSILPSTGDRSIRGSIWATKAQQPDEEPSSVAQHRGEEGSQRRHEDILSSQQGEATQQHHEEHSRSEKGQSPAPDSGDEQLFLATMALADKLSLSERESTILGLINNPDLPISSVCDAIVALRSQPATLSTSNRTVQVISELVSRIN